MSDKKQTDDAFAAIAAMDPQQENRERLARLENPGLAPIERIDLPLGRPGKRNRAPRYPTIRTEKQLAAAVRRERKRHAPFLANHAPQLRSRQSSIHLKNFQWRLRPGRKWIEVTLPHYGGPMGRQTAEYRTRFTLPASVRRKEAQVIRFTGVDYKAHVFVNGVFVGSHEGFFAPFEFVITDYLKDGENELLVLVENDAIARGNQSWFHDAEGEKLYAATFIGWDEPELAWHHGPPGMGIWGEVTIEGRSRTHIGDLFVRPLPDEEAAELWIEVFNTEAGYAEDLSFTWSLYGQNFKAVLVENAGIESDLRFGPNNSILKYRIHIPDPRLWSPETPWLYQLQVKLYREGKLQDTMAQQFGMRTFRIDEITTPKGKIFLNGEEIRLRGANTMGFEQLAAMRGEWDRLIDDILLTKICGMNFWRVTQRPVQREIYDLCDRLGLMVQSDLPHFGNVRLTQFAESVRQSEEMERHIRRHPSSVLISYINEPFPEAWHGMGHRHLNRTDLENLFEACTHAVHVHNPDRAVKPIDGDYDPPGPGIADTHCYNGWYRWDRLTLGAMNKGYWHQSKPGWHTGCGEFGAEGLDPADLMRRHSPGEWLTPDPRYGWNPGQISHCQTGRHQPMWFEAPEREGEASLEEWVEASQAFQEWIVRLSTEAFRRDDRMVTFAIHLFIDAWPTGWMKCIMDCERRPKKAFFAYLEALRPKLVTLRMDRWHYFEGEAIEAEAHISNDTHDTGPLDLYYSIEKSGKALVSGKRKIAPAKLGSRYVGHIAWKAPPVSRRTTFTVRATLVERKTGQPVSESSWPVHVLPKPESKLPAVRRWKGRTPDWLRKLGTPSGRRSDTLVADGQRLRHGELENLVEEAKAGARVILYQLPVGEHAIDGETVCIVETANGPRYCASRNTGHPIVSPFQPNDFRFWLDETTDYPTPFHDTNFVSENWVPIVRSATGLPRSHPLAPPTDRIFRPSHVVAEKPVGEGSVVVCQLRLDNYVNAHPVARLFAERLLAGG